MVSPSGLTGIIAFGTTSLTTKTKCAVYFSRLVAIEQLKIDCCLCNQRQQLLKSRSPVVHAHRKPGASSKTDSQVSVQTHEWRISSRSYLLLCCRFASEVDLYS